MNRGIHAEQVEIAYRSVKEKKSSQDDKENAR